MENPNVRYRKYCVTCCDYTLHTKNDKTKICTSCDTIYNPETIDFNAIEKTKILRQRQRYTEYKRQQFRDMFVTCNIFESISANGFQRVIIEDDAGQYAIDEAKKAERARLQQLHNQIRIEYHDKFANLNRNDKCGCGSGKKYKQCCIGKYRQLGISKN